MHAVFVCLLLIFAIYILNCLYICTQMFTMNLWRPKVQIYFPSNSYDFTNYLVHVYNLTATQWCLYLQCYYLRWQLLLFRISIILILMNHKNQIWFQMSNFCSLKLYSKEILCSYPTVDCPEQSCLSWMI